MLFSDLSGQISSRPPSVSFLDHGFLFGDSLYEVVRVYDRKILGWAEHRERLLRGAQRIGLEITASIPEIESRMKALLSQLSESSAALRMVVTRGVGKLHIDWRSCAVPSIYMAAWKFDVSQQPKEVRLWVADIRRNSILALDPSIKSGNYLNNVLALKEAVQNGYDDAVMLNPDGNISELTTSNIGWVKGGRVFTSDVDAGILHGVTRKLLLEAINVTTEHSKIEALFTADEIFAISTFKEITPVTALGASDGRKKTLAVGSVTLGLQKSLKAKIEQKLVQEKPVF